MKIEMKFSALLSFIPSQFSVFISVRLIEMKLPSFPSEKTEMKIEMKFSALLSFIPSQFSVFISVRLIEMKLPSFPSVSSRFICISVRHNSR